MARMATSVPITGSVLSWAMAEAGLDPEDLARDLGVSWGTVRGWEEGVEEPNATQFHKLANRLGRPESFFLLPRPPARTPVPASYRRGKDAGEVPSVEEAAAVRRARKAAQVVSWIRRRDNPDYRVVIPRAFANEAPAVAADRLRTWLGWQQGTFVGFGHTDASARTHVRASIQSRGLLAIHFSLSDSNIRGFALPDSAVPLVAVNTSDSNGARLFSYGHELAHLILDVSSVCDVRVNKGIERWCNQVAASLYMPAVEFRSNVESKLRTSRVDSVDQVSTISKLYGLSLRAVALRFEDLGMAAPGLYEQVNRLTEQKRRGGSPDSERPQTKPRIRLQQLGRSYGSALIDADEHGHMTQAQILELAGMSSGEFAEFKSLVLAGTEG